MTILGVLPILSFLLLLPLGGAAMIAFLSHHRQLEIRLIALCTSLCLLIASIGMIPHFRTAVDPAPRFQFEENLPWIPSPFEIRYHLGIDGLGLGLVLLTALLVPLTILASWKAVEKSVKMFHILILLLETSLIGTFSALDAILFFGFWEASLVPMVFLIGVWGSSRRVYAAVKFLLFTASGSLLMLAALLYLGYRFGPEPGAWNSDLTRWLALTLEPHQQKWLLAGFLLAFAIKIPIFPLHTWLPYAHGEAPTAGSVLLAGVLLKMGAYGMLRFAIPLCPDAMAAASPLLFGLSAIGLVYGGLMAWAQSDLKKLIAYSSISHMGLVTLGLLCGNAEGITGGIYQMFNHGISTGALFLIAGMLYERTHSRRIEDYGGLASSTPMLATCLGITVFSSIALPGLNGFVGEFLVLVGAFQKARWLAIPICTAVVLGAIYLLGLYRRIAFGPPPAGEGQAMADLNGREIAILSPLIGLMFWMGLYPGPFLARLEPTCLQWILP
jgi:NADH-quinone oxidoreductase subunit M